MGRFIFVTAELHHNAVLGDGLSRPTCFVAPAGHSIAFFVSLYTSLECNGVGSYKQAVPFYLLRIGLWLLFAQRTRCCEKAISSLGPRRSKVAGKRYVYAAAYQLL